MLMQILKQSYFRFGPSEGVTTSWESHRTRSFRAEWRMGFSQTLLGNWVRTWWFSHGAPRTMPFTWYYGTFLLRSRASPSRRQKQHFHLNLSSLVRITFPSIHRLPRGLCNVPLSKNEIKPKWSFKLCRPQVRCFCNSLRSAAFDIQVH